MNIFKLIKNKPLLWITSILSIYSQTKEMVLFTLELPMTFIRRIVEHKYKYIKGFTEKYKVDKHVYYETFKYINDAIQRESNLKAWKRRWKIELIEKENKYWKDLFYDLTSEEEIKGIRENIEYRILNELNISK